MRMLLVIPLVATLATAAEIPVPPGQPVQAAIAGASDGDVVRLAAGTYDGDVDFLGKAITVVGVGPATVLRGTGTGPVVRFTSGETPASVLDSVMVTGGLADRGGGIHVADGAPTIVRCVISGNRALLQGSGVFLTRSTALLRNNLIVFNGTASGDPHMVEVQDAAPTILNNTIARGDSNGLILRGPGATVVENNVIAYNGSSVDGDRRGRGICDFSGGLARIRYNVFFRNRVAALLTAGTDYRRVARAETEIGAPRLEGNLDGAPAFAGSVRRPAARVPLGAFLLRTRGRNVARNAGNPDPASNDRDGSPADAGFTGGPEAPTWTF